MPEHLEGLNPKQKEAAIHIKGPLLIIAGAGAGKTKTITHRIVHLIKNGIAPTEILAVTFTNKAAKEMSERVLAEIAKSSHGREDSRPFISTFHSLGVHIIKENARALGFTKYFTILDERDSTNLIKDILKDLDLDPKQHDPKKIKNIISREKGKFIHSSEYAQKALGSFQKVVAQVWPLYEKKKNEENSLDFDDLLLKSTKLLKEDEKIRRIYQNKWRYIHIDEYQDTNEVQYLMSKLLVGDEQNICVVGDADQNIYSWRGANLKNILSFEKDYSDTKVVLLEENYRSTANILEAANEIIKKNKFRPEKNLFTKNSSGDKISLYEALDEADEAEFVATKILELVEKNSEQSFFRSSDPRVPYPPPDHSKTFSEFFSEVAVLYRANFQSRVLEEAMLRYNVPYQVLGVKFFERREVKDTLAYLRAALNKDSLSDIKRIINFPKRGIGKVTLAKIFSGQRDTLPVKMKVKLQNFYELLEKIEKEIRESRPSQVIKYVLKHSGIEQELYSGGEEDLERLENIKELATLALKYDNLKSGRGIEKLLEDAALSSDQDSLLVEKNKKEKVNAVKLMTVHASKGLEFKYVFVVGLEDGLFPSQRDGETTAEDAEEERRLFYVALTRAERKLFLSFASFRTIFGSRQINTPSEFIADIPGDLLEEENNKLKTIQID